MARERLSVVAGALFDAAGRVLITERPAGRTLAGRWEFPGGKIRPHETPRAALARELHEELGIDVARSEHVQSLTHEYPDRSVDLHFHLVTQYSGTPSGLDGQCLRWCTPAELGTADILEADRPFVQTLQRRSRGESA
jgi:8-oxo-dGTP diphosphatase